MDGHAASRFIRSFLLRYWWAPLLLSAILLVAWHPWILVLLVFVLFMFPEPRVMRLAGKYIARFARACAAGLRDLSRRG